MNIASAFSKGFFNTITGSNYEQVLFILVLFGIFILKDWKKAFGLITLFVVSYFAMVVLLFWKTFSFSADLRYAVVPVAILIIAVGNFLYRKNLFSNQHPSQRYRYLLTAVFGALFGILFFQAAQLSLGKGSNLGTIAEYTSGIVSAHLAILFCVLTLATLLVNFLNVKRREWLLFVTGVASGGAILTLSHM